MKLCLSDYKPCGAEIEWLRQTSKCISKSIQLALNLGSLKEDIFNVNSATFMPIQTSMPLPSFEI